jgi:hypothetical protein
MTVDSLGAMADRQHHSVGSDNCVGIQLGFEAFKVMFAIGATNLIPCLVIKEKNFGSMMVMDLLSKGQKAVQHWHWNTSLLKAGSSVVCYL